jgi:feruloyl-CoA synthase
LSAGELEAAIVEGMRRLRGEGGGSSQVPTRALVQAEPTDVEAGEITDKGYINQRAVIARRTAEIAALYEDGNPRVMRA